MTQARREQRRRQNERRAQDALRRLSEQRRPGDGPITYADLELADIILTRAPTPGSWGIRLGTWAPYSHAMVYIGNEEIIHSEPPDPGTTRAIKLEELSFALEAVGGASVYRHLRAGNQRQRENVVQYLRRAYDQGGGYDWSALGNPILVILQAAGLIDGVGAWDRTRFHCSELVAYAYQQAGLPIVHHRFGRPHENPETYAPADLYRATDSLRRIGILRGYPSRMTPEERRMARHGRGAR